MRVGLVCPYSLSVPGGVQAQVIGLARALHAAGVEARVLGPCDGPPPETWVTPLGKSLPYRDNGSMAPIAPDMAANLRTLRALRDEEFDVVHIHEPFAPGPSMTALVAAPCPRIGTFHRAGASNWVRTMSRLSRWGSRQLAVRAAVSEEARATAAEVVGGEWELVWNGIEIDRHRRAEPWPADEPTILFIGRHESRKGLDVLLEAMSWLGRDVRLWVAGQGPDTERLRKSTADDDRIEWIGLVSEEEKLRRIRGANVLCAPSLHGESFGVVLLEGLAAGTPVVASDLPGYRNVARPGVEARMVPPGDPEKLAKALSAALDEPAETAEMVARGLSRAEGFSMSSLAGVYLEMYHRTL